MSVNTVFPSVRIGQIAQVRGGKRLPKGKLVQDEPTSHPYLRVTDFRPDGLDRTNISYIDPETYQSIKRYTITADEVYISIAGTIGLVGIVPEALSGANLTENAAKICQIAPSMDKQYLMYFLRTDLGQARILSKVGGVAQPKLALYRIEEIEVPIPPLPTQRKIAAIPSAYDDLIEVNTRRIAILEEMARGLYREWFVRFRFPGHEGVRMVESAVGLAPEGWEVRPLADFVRIRRDNINPGQFPDETFAHFSIPAYDEGRMPLLEKGETIKSGKFLLSQPCVLLSKLNPRIPRVWFAEPEATNRAISSSEFLVLTPRSPVNRVFLYAICSSQEFLDVFTGLALGTSTSHQWAKPDDLLKLLWAVPSASLMTEFARQAEPMLDQMSLLRQKNANLHRTRDLLLPRLVAGEVNVSKLEIGEGRAT